MSSNNFSIRWNTYGAVSYTLSSKKFGQGSVRTEEIRKLISYTLINSSCDLWSQYGKFSIYYLSGNGKQIQSLHDVTPSSSSGSIVHRISLHHSNNNQPLTSEEFSKLLFNTSITFAISGADYRNLRENFSSDVLSGFAQLCSVYSRMKPDQKTQVGYSPTE